jgi:hypothetical protein
VSEKSKRDKIRNFAKKGKAVKNTQRKLIEISSVAKNSDVEFDPRI